jgi:hypothetical protein
MSRPNEQSPIPEEETSNNVDAMGLTQKPTKTAGSSLQRRTLTWFTIVLLNMVNILWVTIVVFVKKIAEVGV